jgi:hypothetical protein
MGGRCKDHTLARLNLLSGALDLASRREAIVGVRRVLAIESAAGKVGMWPPGKVFREGDAVDYWEGEAP